MDYDARSALRALPSPTCPAIDRIIRDVYDALTAIARAKGSVEDDGVIGWLETAERELEGVEDALEKVRAANLALRQAAESHIEDCATLRADIRSLEQEAR